MRRSPERGRLNEALPETGRHVYELPEAVSVYEPSHHIPDSVKAAMARQVLEAAGQSGSRGTGALRVLDAGIGGGRLLLLPLLESAGEAPLEVVGIDNSEAMLRDLGRNLKDRGFSPQPPAAGWADSFACSRTGSSVRVVRADLESLDGACPGLEGSFDVVMSILTLHHLANWRLALLPLLRRLTPGGLFVAFEWCGDMRLRDGNFTSCGAGAPAGPIAEFWRRFYEKRWKFHPWAPEISASDYQALCEALLEPFFSKVDAPLLPEWPEDARVTWATVIGWIRHRAYSNFHRGLTTEQSDSLPDIAEKILGDLGMDRASSTGERLGCRLHLFRLNQPWRPELDDSVLQTVRCSSLLHKTIHEERVKARDRTTRFATMLVQHDMLTNESAMLAINKWNLLGDEWDHADKALVVRFDPAVPAPQRRQRLEDSARALLVYHAIVEACGFSVTDFVFRALEEKPVLVLRRTGVMGVRRHRLKNGSTVLLEIRLPEGLLDAGLADKALGAARQAAAKAAVDVWREMRPLKEGVFDLWPWVKDRYREIARRLSKKSLLACVPRDQGLAFRASVGESLEASPRLVRTSSGRDVQGLDGFVNILAFHLTLPEWEWLAYVPSEMLVQENETFQSRGFGGVILAERGGASPALERFREHRLELLRNAVNLRFRTEGSVQAGTLSAHNAINMLEHELRAFFPEETLLQPTQFQLAHLSKILGLLRGPSCTGPATSLTYSITESFLAAFEAVQRRSMDGLARPPQALLGACLHIRLASRRTQAEIAVVAPQAADRDGCGDGDECSGERWACIPGHILRQCREALAPDQIHELELPGSRAWGCVMVYSERERVQHRQIEYLKLRDKDWGAYAFVHRGLGGAMGGLIHNALKYNRFRGPWAEVIVEITEEPGEGFVRLTVTNPMDPLTETGPDGSVNCSFDHGIGMARRFFNSFGKEPRPRLGLLRRTAGDPIPTARIDLWLPFGDAAGSMVFPSGVASGRRRAARGGGTQ